MIVVTTYRKPAKAPCSDCPFRRKAMPGWLGAANPQSFITAISMEQPLPCHQTIDYTNPDWKVQWEAQKVGNICAGALIMSANMCKLPRDRSFPRLERDVLRVFKLPQEFIDYHENAELRSWEMDDD